MKNESPFSQWILLIIKDISTEKESNLYTFLQTNRTHKKGHDNFCRTIYVYVIYFIFYINFKKNVL